jgi:ATP-binding cassette, subfamily B, bacterial PglK
MKYIKKLFSLLDSQDKKGLIYLLLFSILVSIVEAIGVSAIMPFLAVANDFGLITSNLYYSAIFEYFSFVNEIDFVAAFGFILIVFYMVRSIINMLFVYAISKFSYMKYHSITYRLLENYIGRSYGEYLKSNSSEHTKSIVVEADNITKIISSAFYIISEFFVVVLIYAILMTVDWKVTLFLTVFLMINALALIKVLTKKIHRAGDRREYFQKRFHEIINSTFGNFKIIKLKDGEGKVKKNFSKSCLGYSMTNVTNQTLTAFPRLFLEGLSFIVIIIMSLYLLYRHQGSISESIPMISIFVLGLYRLMPSVNRIITNYNAIIFNHMSLSIVHNDLIYEKEQLGNDEIIFEKRIEIKDLGFEYLTGREILSDINLTINKGESIAFIGQSGGGKSTLIDIIMGLFRPKYGHIYVDGKLLNDSNIKLWRKKIGYVPQTVYLFDGTVAQNVAFSDSINLDKVKSCLSKANLLDFLERYHDGIDTNVGEGGVLLSGGQKQRVAIARALYNDPEILILDEATSALDEKTESKIMSEIYHAARDKTLLIIAHRLSTIKKCDKVYKIVNNKSKLVTSKDNNHE